MDEDGFRVFDDTGGGPLRVPGFSSELPVHFQLPTDAPTFDYGGHM